MQGPWKRRHYSAIYGLPESILQIVVSGFHFLDKCPIAYYRIVELLWNTENAAATAMIICCFRAGDV